MLCFNFKKNDYEVHTTLSMASDIKGLRLALGYQSRTGKDTCADYIIAAHSGYVLRFAAGVYEISEVAQLATQSTVRKDPILLQKLGEMMCEHYGPTIWINRVESEINKILQHDPLANIIIVDMRKPAEMDMLSRHGFKTVKILRRGRIVDRDPNHITEIGLRDAVFDYCIENDTSMPDFHAQIDRLVLDLTKK